MGLSKSFASLNPKGATHPCVRRENNGVQSLPDRQPYESDLKGNLIGSLNAATVVLVSLKWSEVCHPVLCWCVHDTPVIISGLVRSGAEVRPAAGEGGEVVQVSRRGAVIAVQSRLDPRAQQS